MSEKRTKRKLSGILSADAVGYSRLMRENELETVRTLEDSRKLITILIQKYRGRVVDSPGDNLLAEFASIVDAVECAMAIQQEIKAKNAGIPENRKMEFRIGVNIGDVIEEGERIYGDGVNIAARIEGLASAGGICISGTVYEHVKDKLTLEFGYLGEQTVKNFSEPIKVYSVLMESEDITSKENGEFILPDKPSIAVLPFANISGDPEQEYFSDGITEDLITDLSKISGLFIIARNSVFTYKGKPVKVQEVSRDLGVKYILEGSVRKAANRVRITAQLVDTTTGGHLWAERYDRDLKDIFAVQDEVTQEIVGALAVKLTEGETDRLTRKYTDNLEAYDYALRGLDYYFRRTKEATILALQMFERAVEIDPLYALAYSLLGLTHLHSWTMGWNRNPQTLELAYELAQKAISLDDSLPEAHRTLGDVYLYKKQQEQALAEREKAVALNPNSADSLAGLGEVLIYIGKIEDGIALLKKAIRLNPHHDVWYFWELGIAFIFKNQYDKAEEILKRAIIRNPDFIPIHGALAFVYVETGRIEEARTEVKEMLRISPEFSTELIREMLPLKDQEMLEWAIEVLQKAGLK
jgi:adenylate cyclase